MSQMGIKVWGIYFQEKYAIYRDPTEGGQDQKTAGFSGMVWERKIAWRNWIILQVK